MIAELEASVTTPARSVGQDRSILPSASVAESLKKSASKVVSSASDVIGRSRTTNSVGGESISASELTSESSSTPRESEAKTAPSDDLYNEPLSASRHSRIRAWNHGVFQPRDRASESQPEPSRARRRQSRSEAGSTKVQAEPARSRARKSKSEAGPAVNQPEMVRPRARSFRDQTGARAAPLPDEIPTIPEDVEADGDIKVELIRSMVKIALKNLDEARTQQSLFKSKSRECERLGSDYRNSQKALQDLVYRTLMSQDKKDVRRNVVSSYKKTEAASRNHWLVSLERGSKAEKGFNLALTESEKLPEGKRSVLDEDEIRLNLAFAYEVCQKSEESKKLLLDIAGPAASPGSANLDNALTLRACHALAQLYKEIDQIDEANAFCRRALLGRRRILGPTDPLYKESMRLTIDICRANGETELAEAYEAALSQSEREAQGECEAREAREVREVREERDERYKSYRPYERVERDVPPPRYEERSRARVRSSGAYRRRYDSAY